MRYLSVSSPPTPHLKVSCREGWRLAGYHGGEHVIWEQGRFPRILLCQGGEEKNCQFTGLPGLYYILQGCPLPPQFSGKAA